MAVQSKLTAAGRALIVARMAVASVIDRLRELQRTPRPDDDHLTEAEATHLRQLDAIGRDRVESGEAIIRSFV
jgi:hypothetical protein